MSFDPKHKWTCTITSWRISNWKHKQWKKLLGVKIDSELLFDKHIKTICKKASNKLRALARFAPYITIEKKNVLLNSF